MSRGELALRLAVLAALATLPACSSCRSNDEPTRDPKFDPASDASTRAPPLPSSGRGGLTAAELRDLRTKLDPDLCSEGAKRVNSLHGRTPTDPVGVQIVATCLKYGNTAWYACVLQATTAEAADACGRKLLQPPDEP